MRVLVTATLVLALGASLGLAGARQALGRQPAASPPVVWPPPASAAPPEAQAPAGPPPETIDIRPKPLIRPLASGVPAAVARRPSPKLAPTATPRPGATPTPAAVQSEGPLAPGAPIPPDELQAFVDGAVGEAMAEDHIAGVSVSVVQDGQMVLTRGYGFAGPGRPVDPNRTLFRLGGASQLFTWMALMREAEAGRIRLATPINLYLPERLQVRDQGFRRPVLAGDLADHSAGFEDRALGHLFEQDPRQIRPLADYLREERPRRVREAGAAPSFSDYGAALAGEAVAWVEGRSYQDVVDSGILRPLGLSHTTFAEPYPARADLPAPMPASLAGDLAGGYRWTRAGLTPERFEYATQIAPAEAASSTAGDMARVMLAILGGGQLDGAIVYGPATAHAFGATAITAAPGVAGWDDGLREYDLPGGVRGQGEDGATLWFRSRMVVAPALNLGIFVAADTDTGGRLVDELAERIVARFYVAPQPLPRPGDPALADQRQVYDGVYVTTRRAYSGLEKFVDLLRGQAVVEVTGDGRLLVRRNGATRVFTPHGSAGAFIEADGPRTTAFAIEDGRAVRWFPPSGGEVFERAGPLARAHVLLGAVALAVLTSLATLIGAATRDRREFRQTPAQGRADLVQITIALLWLVTVALTLAWARRAGDAGWLMYHWPGLLLMTASASALMAAVLTLLTLLMAPAVWRGGRRVDSWTGWRKLRFTISTLVFTGASVVLAAWGALQPWG